MADCASATWGIRDCCVVAAPGPLPKAATEPTCLEAVGDGEEAGFSGLGGFAVGRFDTDVEDLGVTSVAAPGPSPNAGTEPTCFEAVTSPFRTSGVALDAAS